MQQLGAPDLNGNQATTGYVGHLLGPTRKPTTRAWLVVRRTCGSHGAVTIHLSGPRGPEHLASARVYVDGKQVAVRRGRRPTAPIMLRRVPRGAVTVRVIAWTNRHRRLVFTRTYRPCTTRKHG